tara:strand:- start:21 stop:188 length:168 start_codon:yes stop_codon:yes gene_type:complete
MEDQLNEIDGAIDALDEMIMRLPLQDSVKRDLAAHLYTMWEELEEHVELRPADFG